MTWRAYLFLSALAAAVAVMAVAVGDYPAAVVSGAAAFALAMVGR